jgi:hypothetical protein
MGFQDLLIADFLDGQRLDKESWLTPNNAFKNLENVFLRRGIIQKRYGYSVLARVGTSYLEASAALGSSNYTALNLPVLAGSVYIRDTVEYFTDDGLGVLTGSEGGSGTIVYATGVMNVTFNAGPTGTPTVAYQVLETGGDLTIRGIFNLENSLASDRGIVMDRQKLLEYNANTGVFDAKPLAGTGLASTGVYDYFSGATQLVDGIEFFEKFYFTDGLDVSLSSGIWKYDPTAGDFTTSLGEVSQFEPQLSSNVLDIVTKALIIKPYYRHLVLFNVIEGTSATAHRQRARWSKVDAGNNITTDWLADVPGGGSSLDAATNETLVAAGMVKGTMVVAFERSIWIFDYTGNKDVPFRWRHLEGELHIGSTFATVEAENMVIFIGEGGIYGCDGIRVEELSKKIPDFTLEDVENNQFAKCSAVYDERLNQILLSYPATSNDTGENTRMKVIGIDEGWFTDYDYGMRSTGSYVNDTETTWNDLITKHGDSWEEIIGKTFAEITKQSKETIVLGGSTDGYVYILNDSSAVVDSPDGVATKFNFVIESKDYAPFVEQGQQTTLGYLDIFNSAVTDSSYTVYLKMNDQDGSYKVQNVSLTGANKIWKRVLGRQTGNSHYFRYRSDDL